MTPMKHFVVFGTDLRGTTPLTVVEAPDAAAARLEAETRFPAWPQVRVQLAMGEMLADIRRFFRQRGARIPTPARRCKCGTEFTPLTRDHTACSFACAMRLDAFERKALHRQTPPTA